jgi:2-haloacid dehalogenase
MSPAPSVVVFDVNETLSDMSPMAGRFTDLGLPEHLAKLWFVAQQPFATIGEGVLRTVLAGVEPDRDIDAAVEHVMAGFSQLPVHPGVPDGVRELRATGRRLVTMSNGSAQVAEKLLGDAGIREEFEALMSVEDAGAWKPDREAYGYAARACGAAPDDMLLVAAHPWDIDGAARAGMHTAWINRTGVPYPGHFTAPEHTVTALTDLAGRLG